MGTADRKVHVSSILPQYRCATERYLPQVSPYITMKIGLKRKILIYVFLHIPVLVLGKQQRNMNAKTIGFCRNPS